MKFLQSLIGNGTFFLLVLVKFHVISELRFTFFAFLLARTRFAARGGSLGRVSGVRFFCAPSEEYYKRNYANNVSEYNTVFGSLTAQRRFFFFLIFKYFWLTNP